MDHTKIYSNDEFQKAFIIDVLKEIADILEDRGYDAKNQIVGYLMSGDPGYISSHKEARNKITQFDRTQILEALVGNFIK